MKTSLLAAMAALSFLVPCLADTTPNPANIEASFDGARLADDLSGTFSGDPSKEIRVRVYASAGSNVSATLSPDPATAAPIPGLTLHLCDDLGGDLGVAGSKYDKTVAGTGVITWRRVPMPTTGGCTFILRGTGAGAWRLKLRGALAKIVETHASPADLAVNAQTSVDFQGLRGATAAFSVAPKGSSKFSAALLRVERPDGTAIDGFPADTTNPIAKGKVVLDADGTHHLVFKNVGPGIGPWNAKIIVTPPKIVARRGFVAAAGTSLVPIVGRVTPAADYHLDDAADVTLTGRDFQQGADVRLVRNGFDDIVATDVEVDSETRIRCKLNLATAPVTGKFSTGKWLVGVWNAPVYLTPGDPKTLDKTRPTRDTKRPFVCLSAAAITLPNGVIKNTETWQLVFNDDFQTDLNHMGLGSTDKATARLAKNAVEAYVVCFLRTLMKANETNGKLLAGTSPSISFVVGKIPSPAGKPGRDYDRIEIGGAWQTGDPQDPNEPLAWGFAPLNQHPVDLSINVDDGAGGTMRAGFGVRTDVLSILSPTINPDFANALSPLNQNKLTSADAQYFAPGFGPSTVAEANRYRDIVNQITRVAREIAALVAHHVGRAMGLAPGGTGPMASPATSGYLWPTTTGLAFAPADLNALVADAAPRTLPGKSAGLAVHFFPLLATQPSLLPDSTAAVDYGVNWNFVGGRANAVPADYSVKLASTIPVLSSIPLQGTVTATYQGLSITGSPVYIDASAGLPYGGIAFLRLTATDVVRGGSVVLFYRLNVQPNFQRLPTFGVVFQRAVSLQQFIANN